MQKLYSLAHRYNRWFDRSREMHRFLAFILPMVIVFSVLGAFALNNRAFDIWVMLAVALVGYGVATAVFPFLGTEVAWATARAIVW